jgi:hypothetical protein
MFFASPQFPRLLDANTIKDTIARGVSGGIVAYIGKNEAGEYSPFTYESSLLPSDLSPNRLQMRISLQCRQMKLSQHQRARMNKNIQMIR